MNNLGIKELKSILYFYDVQIPKNIHLLKKKACHVMIRQLCVSNCETSGKYQKLLLLLNKKRVISYQKKKKQGKTKKRYMMIYKQTRVMSPIRYLEA